MQPDTSLMFEAFADPTRREILSLLSQREMAVGEIVGQITHVSRTTVSSHLRVLRSAGLVSERRDGRFRHYSINPAPATEVVGFLAQVYKAPLEGLKAMAEEAADVSRTSASRDSA